VASTPSKPEAVSLKVTLRGIKPPIWRRLLVPGVTTLAQLSLYLQAAMEWAGHHLHLFDIAGREYGDPQTVDQVADERRMTINGLRRAGVSRFQYIYDFGDNWEMTVVIEKKTPPRENSEIPVCVDGRRSGPPENSGGPEGYDDVLKIIVDPTHPDHDDWIVEVGDDFDPETFDIDIVNTVLAARARRTAASSRRG
jgi:hypothetical protein